MPQINLPLKNKSVPTTGSSLRPVVISDCNCGVCPFVQQVAYPDVAPVMLLSEASVKDLSSRLEKGITVKQFRPNIVISDCEAFAEVSGSASTFANITLISCPCLFLYLATWLEMLVTSRRRKKSPVNNRLESQKVLEITDPLCLYTAEHEVLFYFSLLSEKLSSGALLVTNTSPFSVWAAWTKFISNSKTNCFAFSGFVGRDPDWQCAAAACNVMWKVTWWCFTQILIRDSGYKAAVWSLLKFGVWFPG